MFPLKLPKMAVDDKQKDLIRKCELVFAQGEQVKVAVGEAEMIKLALGEKLDITTNGFSFHLKNGMILGASKSLNGTSLHCFKPRCKERPIVQKPWCADHQLKQTEESLGDPEEKSDTQDRGQTSKRTSISQNHPSPPKRAKLDTDEGDIEGDSDVDDYLQDLFT